MPPSPRGPPLTFEHINTENGVHVSEEGTPGQQGPLEAQSSYYTTAPDRAPKSLTLVLHFLKETRTYFLPILPTPQGSDSR